MSAISEPAEVEQTGKTRGVWRVRVMLAALLMFGGEVLLWSDPFGRAWWEWPLLIAGYIALAAVTLDLMARWRVRDLFGLMALAGFYALLNGMLLNPALVFVDLPRTLVSRVTGAHALIGLEMLLIFLCLTGGHIRYLRTVLMILALVIGLAWGTWVRWSPTYADVVYGDASLMQMLGMGGAGLAIIALLIAAVYRLRVPVYPRDALLRPLEWVLVALALTVIGLIRIATGALTETGLLLSVIVMVLTALVLWSRRGTRLHMYLDYHLPLIPVHPVRLMLAAAVMIWAALLAYGLPVIGGENFNQLYGISYGFLAYGLGWLPLVSVQLGLRAFVRQFEAQSL